MFCAVALPVVDVVVVAPGVSLVLACCGVVGVAGALGSWVALQPARVAATTNEQHSIPNLRRC